MGDRRKRAGVLADRPREPVLRQEPGQPRLVSPDRPGDRRAGRRLPRLEPRLQRRAARRPDRRVRQERLRPQGADPLDPRAAGPTSSSARTNELNADDTLYFSHAYTKLLPAEVLLDAISTVTGTITPFDGLPKGTRATQIPDGKMENPFLKTFGRPARELACECERESDSNLSQALQLIGGATVNGKLRDDNGRMAALAKSDKHARGDHPRALPGRPRPRAERDRGRRRRQAPDRRRRPPPGRRGPGLGPDQLQGVPVPALSRLPSGAARPAPTRRASEGDRCRRPSLARRVGVIRLGHGGPGVGLAGDQPTVIGRDPSLALPFLGSWPRMPPPSG